MPGLTRRWLRSSWQSLSAVVAIVAASVAVARWTDDPMVGLGTTVAIGFVFEWIMLRTPWVAMGTAMGAFVAVLFLPHVQMSPPRSPGPVGSMVLHLFLAGVGFAIGLAIETNQR